MRSARARKRSDQAHTCSTLWLGVPRIFLIAPLSYDAVAFYLHRGEQRLRYEKLATSSLVESIQVQLREVGIELELEEADLVATITPKRRERKTNWYLSAGVPSKKAVEAQIALFNAGKGLGHWFEDDTLYQMWVDLLQITDPKAYDEQLRKIGNYKFDNFEIMPLFDVSIEVVVNPKIIQDWPFSGWDGGDMGHTFLITACKQEPPCK
jgi:hypothetical protein